MIWWQIVLILLAGVLPSFLVAAFILMVILDIKSHGIYEGEILSRLNGIEKILNRERSNDL